MKFAIPLLLMLGVLPFSTNLKKSVDNYQRKEIQAHYFFIAENQKVIYFEDSLQNLKCAIYLQSQVETVTDRKKPDRTPTFVADKPNMPSIFLNNTFINVTNPLDHADKMVPESISSFTLYDDAYVMINMMYLSYTVTYNAVIMKLDKSNHVKQQWVVATEEPLTGKMLGDDNGDHVLDYKMNKETYTIEGNLKIK